MEAARQSAAALAARSAGTRRITGTVALLATLVFAISGWQVLPAVVASLAGGSTPNANQITAFLLNIALILFAWRRSAQLIETGAALRDAEQRAFGLAYYDEVTGLFNRRRLIELLTELCATSAKAALVIIDLDRFKKINDLYGHTAGDEVLRAVAKRIEAVSPVKAVCCRLGGDEFAVLFQGGSANRKDLEQFAAFLLSELQEPISLANTDTAIGVSIGIAVRGKDCRQPKWLFERADAAMYEAKRLGRNRWVCFDEGMEEQLERRTRLESDIRLGIERGEFVPYFQPIIDLASGYPRGFEVLARWNHPIRGVLEPVDFLQLAEDGGLISELSFGVMHKALTLARNWPGHLRIAVNLSPVQLQDPLIAQRILKLLADTGFPAGRLEVEIMERSLLEDHEQTVATLTSLKNNGIGVSIDDLGMGYANISTLQSLPFDRIKIDRKFLRGLKDDGSSDALVHAIASLGRGLKLPITAEGVESDMICDKLAELGCVDAQGWLFAKALSAEEVRLGFGDDMAALRLPLAAA